MRYLFLIIVILFVNFKGVKAQSRAQDSSTLLSFFSKTLGDQWTNKSSWKLENINYWYGIRLKNNLVNGIVLPSNKLKGSLLSSDLPNHLVGKIDLSGNQLTSFPPSLSIDTLLLANNKLSFNHLLPYAYLGNKFSYLGQDSVEQNISVFGQQRNEITLSTLTDNGVTGIKYQWYKNGQIIAGATNNILNLTCLIKSNEGAYICRISHNDLPNLFIFRKSIFLLVAEDKVNAGADDNVCKGTYTLSATNPMTGSASWSVEKSNGEITDIFDPNSGVTGLTYGANIFRWYVNYGSCPIEFDEVIIFKDTVAELPSAGKDVVFCDSFYTLNATPLKYGKGSWELVSGNLIFGQITNPQSKLLAIAPGEHVLRWNANNGACASFFDEMKLLRELPLKQVFAGKDTALCGRELFLNAKSQPNVKGRWKLISGNAKISDTTIEYTYIHSIAEGINKLEWTGWNVCNNKVKDTLNVKVYNAVKVDLGLDTKMYLIPSSSLSLTNDTPATRGNGKFKYEWTPTVNLLAPNSPTGQFEPPTTGVYNFKLLVTDEMGCKDSGTRTIEIIQVEKIDAPTLFTPNDDGNNDLFILPGIESYPNNELIVMDKLGQPVFKQKGYDNQWNGTASIGSYSGDLLPDDTYFYVLDLGVGKEKVQTGFIVIKK